MGSTRPGSRLKHLIPVKTDQWDVTKAGYLEIDLVSHSGACAAGEVLDTLDSVDIQTGWVERQAVVGQGRHGIVAAIRAIEAPRPFGPVGALASDHGSEFINDPLWAFGQRPGQPIQFTRSRPSKQGRPGAYRAEARDACAHARGRGSGRECRGASRPQRPSMRPCGYFSIWFSRR